MNERLKEFKRAVKALARLRLDTIKAMKVVFTQKEMGKFDIVWRSPGWVGWCHQMLRARVDNLYHRADPKQ